MLYKCLKSLISIYIITNMYLLIFYNINLYIKCLYYKNKIYIIIYVTG